MVVYLNSDRELNRYMESRRIKVSEKRQITIPKSFYEKLKLGNEVECVFDKDNGAILIRPIVKEDYFSEYILNDLVKQGYGGEELLAEFRRVKRGIRPAVEKMIEEADQAAATLKGSGDDELEEMFADVED